MRRRRWDGLHLRQAPDVELSVIRVESQLERETLPAPLWLGYHGPPVASVVELWQ